VATAMLGVVDGSQDITSATIRVANLGDFSPKNANLGIFLAFGELGDF
jgi:hypothetical protein